MARYAGVITRRTMQVGKFKLRLAKAAAAGLMALAAPAFGGGPSLAMLDQLESGPWPSFVTGLKRLANDKDYMVDLMGQLETSYRTRKGYWKGGTVGVFGYGGGVIPRFTELKDENNKPVFPDAAEFHTLRV